MNELLQTALQIVMNVAIIFFAQFVIKTTIIMALREYDAEREKKLGPFRS